jgi:hypothetical protein
VVVVDAKVAGIGRRGIASNWSKLLNELSIFLSIAVGITFRKVQLKSDWVTSNNEAGQGTKCALGLVGYTDQLLDAGFPKKGAKKAIATTPVHRPGLEVQDITLEMSEFIVPEDIQWLWRYLSKLPSETRTHFLRAGNSFLLACSLPSVLSLTD